MGKLYYFGIGGTGSRVLKSLLMLLSAGVKLNATEVVPIIIDPDKGAADMARTADLVREYQQLHAHAKKITATSANTDEDRFFATKVSLRECGLVLPLASQCNKRFEEAVGYNAMEKEQKAIVQLLFSPEVRKMSMEVGFKGNPNMGSIVLNQFDGSKEFQAFLNDFQKDDRIFIAGSIFGGTGASGFPLLVKTLRNLDALPGDVSNEQFIKDSAIGGAIVLPYFAVKKDADSAIDSSTFYSKTIAALGYYEKNLNELNNLYYIGDNCTAALENVEGGARQKNPAHFIELASALAIYDFMETDDAAWKGGQHRYKEYALKDEVTDTQKLDFRHLCDNVRSRIAPGLTQLLFFVNYLRNHLSDAERQPWYIQLGKVFQSPFKRSSLDKIIEMYSTWLAELEGLGNQRSFAPFALDASPDQPFGIVVGYPEKRGFFAKKDYVLFNDKLNTAFKSCKGSTDEAKVLEIFYAATREIVKDKFIF